MKNLFLLIFTIGAFFTASAQVTSIIHSIPEKPGSSLIRYNPTTGHHVTFSGNGTGELHFTTSNLLSTTVDVAIPIHCSINDFDILDNYVFFCGKSEGGNGLFGWFKIGGDEANASDVYIDTSLNGLAIDELIDIEAYYLWGNLNIAGYGIENHPSGAIRYKYINIYGTPGLWMTACSGDLPLTITDMDVTETKAVYVGYLPSGEMALVPFTKNPFGGTGKFYTFHLSSTNSTEPYDPTPLTLKVAHTYYDNFVTIAYQEETYAYAAPNYHLTVREYKASNYIPMLRAFRMQCPQPFNQIKECQYDSIGENLYILNSSSAIPSSPNSLEGVSKINLSAFPTNLIETDLVLSNLSPMSLTLPSSGHYTVCGHNTANGSSFVWQDEYYSVTQQPCTDKVIRENTIVNTVNENEVLWNSNISSAVVLSPIILHPTVTYTACEPICP